MTKSELLKQLESFDDADHDGQRFHDATACEAAVRLQGLKNMGYLVPQYAIDALRHEQGE